MDPKQTCTEAIASAISDMDDGTEVTIELTGTVSTGTDGEKTISSCSAIVENQSAESLEQEQSEKEMDSMPTGVNALAKKKMAPAMV